MGDIVFTALFTFEMSLKLVALGLQYVMDGWNLLDAVVVCEVGSAYVQIDLESTDKYRCSKAFIVLVLSILQILCASYIQCVQARSDA